MDDCERSEYVDLHMVLAHCRELQRILQPILPHMTGARVKIWAHLTDAIDIAERELARMEGENEPA